MTYLLYLLILIFDIDTDQKRILQWLGQQGAALPENDASAELTTANGETFTCLHSVANHIISRLISY